VRQPGDRPGRDRGRRRGAGHPAPGGGSGSRRAVGRQRRGRHHAGRGRRGRGADFLLAVEANQPSLLDAMKQTFDATTGPAYTTKDRGHGRHETRRARTLTNPKIVARVSAVARIAGIRCLCRIERTRITQDGIVTTVHYHISSRPLTPRRYARCARSHWSVEAMHFVLDGALDEDACRIGTAAGAVGALRRLA
jgi:hypothetical protein